MHPFAMAQQAPSTFRHRKRVSMRDLPSLGWNTTHPFQHCQTSLLQRQPSRPLPPSRLLATTFKCSPASSSNPYHSDEKLGNLAWRFNVNNGCFATDEELRHCNSRVAVMDNKKGVEHVMNCGAAMLYLMDDLKTRVHSFENSSILPSPQTNPLVCMN